VFNKNYCTTMGVDFALKVLQWSDDQVIRLQLWDIAGQERFSTMIRVCVSAHMSAPGLVPTLALRVTMLSLTG